MLVMHVWARQLAKAYPKCRLGSGHLWSVRRWVSDSSPVRLRDYQEECIAAVLAHITDGHKRLGISLATGSGKTNATQTLILAHRRELVEQAAIHCTNAYPEKSIDIELGSSHATGTADITIASIQSLMSKDRIDKYHPALFKLVLVDEAHHIVAQQYLQVLEHFGLRPIKKDAPTLVGVSATFSRFDGLKLGSAIDHIVYHKDYLDMIKDGWLSDVIFTTVRMKKANLENVALGTNGDFVASSLAKQVNNPENNEAAVRVWLARCAARKSTIIFCVDVQHVIDLAAAFAFHGVEARYVIGDTHKKLRGDTIDDFKKQHFPVLLNCGVFTEGTDIPNIDCVLLFRPTKSRNLLVQMIGRGMRKCTDKTDCHVIDMVSSLKTGIVTAPTLYGLDPDELVEAASPKQLTEASQRYKAEAMSSSSLGPDKAKNDMCLSFVDYDSIMDLIEDTSGERHIRAISPFAWVQTQEDDYILCGSNGSYIRIYKEKSCYHVKFVAKLAVLTRSPYARPHVISSGSNTFEDAVHAADTYASKIFPFGFIRRCQAWRQQLASEAQINFLTKVAGTQEASGRIPDSLTKGRAFDMITKIKHGARGRFGRIQMAQKKAVKAEQAQADAKERQKHETVQVGPLTKWV